jgi:hypothetical protein
MSRITCDKCQRGISHPFVSRVFTRDGEEYEVKNMLPPGVVEGQAVVVYLHADCKKTRLASARISKGSKARKYMAHVDLTSARRRELSTADALRNLGYDVSANGHRFLMVFPRLMANEVKKIQK